MGPLGVPEMIFIFVLALLIFGPKKLPELGRSLGKGMAEFRRASNELKSTFEREMNNLERENESVKEVTSQYAATPNYDYPYEDYSHSQETTSSASAPQAAETNPAPHPGASPAQGEVKSEVKS